MYQQVRLDDAWPGDLRMHHTVSSSNEVAMDDIAVQGGAKGLSHPDKQFGTIWT